MVEHTRPGFLFLTSERAEQVRYGSAPHSNAIGRLPEAAGIVTLRAT